MRRSRLVPGLVSRIQRRTWRKGIHLKRPEELAIMRQAGRINALVLQTLRQAIRPGVSAAELDELAEKTIRKLGAQPAFKGYPGPYPYPATITLSINDELVHGIPYPDKIIREGDLVSVDCGVIYKGYYADAAFTVAVGEVPPLAQELLRVTKEALDLAIRMAWPGRRTGDISAAIQQFVESHGFHVTRQYTGHGIGRWMHEDPAVPNFGEPGTGEVLRPGMVLALEPMVLVGTEETAVLDDEWTVVSADGSLTAHFEHTVAVTEFGPQVLTKV